MGFAFFIIALLVIGLVIGLIAFFVLLIIGFVFFLVMGIGLRKTETERSVRYFIAAGIALALIFCLSMCFVPVFLF